MRDEHEDLRVAWRRPVDAWLLTFVTAAARTRDRYREDGRVRAVVSARSETCTALHAHPQSPCMCPAVASGAEPADSRPGYTPAVEKDDSLAGDV